MSTKEIYSALKSTLYNSGIGIDIAMPNASYTAETGTPYCECFVLPAQPTAAELGTKKTESVTGVFQINLYYPVDEGDGSLMDSVDVLKSTFGRGENVEYGDTCVRIEDAYASGAPSIDNESWFKQVFDVSWSAYQFLG